MHVNINEEIRDYHEQFFLGLTMRMCIIGILGIGTCLLEYFILQRTLGFHKGFMVILYMFTMIPFGFLMLFKYNNMNAWQFTKIWFRYKFLQDKQMRFKPENPYEHLIKHKMDPVDNNQ